MAKGATHAGKAKAKVDHRLTYGAVVKLVQGNNVSGQADALIVALIYKESRFDPGAKSAAANSSAAGLMQMTRTAVAEVNRVNKTAIDFTTMTGGAANIAAGTTYLKIRIARAKTLAAGLDGYGMGPGYSTSIITAADQIKAMPKGGDPLAILTATIGKP